ncbi:hypothetical protein [Staphylococcus aureus]|uniref:hypothetical protein n=1 Tax=Staphylococcus aureus TaxID=1280 RepID=UPI0033651BEE
MKVFLKIYNTDDIFTSQDFSKKEKDSIISHFNDDLEFPDFLFEQSTMSDLLDLLEFLTPEEVHIFTNNLSPRLKKLLDYLQNKISIVLFTHLINNHTLPFKIEMKSDVDVSTLYNNSIFALKTGLYGLSDNVHLKHIYIDDLNSINYLDESIFLNSGLNSLIIYEKELCENYEFKPYIFSKILHKDNLLKYKKNLKFTFLSNTEVIENIEYFISKGRLKSINSLVIDFYRIYIDRKLFSLFIKNNCIFYDYNKKELISKNISIDAYSLLNEVKLIPFPKSFIKDIYLAYFNCNIISYNLDDYQIDFITKYNDFHFESIMDDSPTIFNEWIGFKQDENYYLFNLLKQRIFNVNQDFIEIFEGIIKNRESSLNYSHELITEAKGLLNSV